MRREPITLMSVADLEERGVRNAARRVKAWCDAGKLELAGVYWPPGGKGIPLYPGPEAERLAEGG